MYQIDFNRPIHVYFVGIGGVSMSGLSEILLSRGFTVSGSDRAPSPTVLHLQSRGIKVYMPQNYENITRDIDLAVFTAAIRPDNPEYKAVQDLGIPMLTRAELLGQIMKNFGLPCCISGTHGKTTTTSMLSEILVLDGKDPTLSVGGNLKSIGGNVRVGGSDCFVCEACEYTNSFLSFFPLYSVILDIDADHLDFFKDINDIRHSFRRFAELLPAEGALIINKDIENVEEISGGLPCRVIYYGSDESCSYYPTDITFDEFARPTYTAHIREGEGETTLRVTLGVTGIHNVYNSLAALAAADLYGTDRSVTLRALRQFSGTDRRFELKGTRDGITIIDDYAHHPTEISATLAAAAKYPHDRLFVVFQPHTYTRTKALMDEFAEALSAADTVVLADIYAAREKDNLGISSDTLREKIAAIGKADCVYFPTFREIEKYLVENCHKNDLLITMGAGNVDDIAKDLLS